jgi:hypothetical protein
MAQASGKKTKKSSPIVGAMMVGFLGGIVFFKGIMVIGDFEMLQDGSYLLNEAINANYAPRAMLIEKEKELVALNLKYEALASRKEAQKQLQSTRNKYESQLKELFEQGRDISKTYKATNADAEAGKIWEDKTRTVLKALSRIETEVQGHSVSLDFQGNFIWYDERNPNFTHAKEIIRERLNDVRN